MTLQKPLISVIMPAYNASRFIAQAIESVLAQTYSSWELIVIDDASSDQTEAVVRGYSDSRIRYHKVARIGHPAGVRNVGLHLAQGEFIAFLDADDLYFPQTLEKLSKPLLNNSALSAAYGFAFNMDEHEIPLPPAIQLLKCGKSQQGESEYQLPSTYSHSWERIVTSQISCMLSALMLRRSAWEKIGFFNEQLFSAEDYEFYIRLFLHDDAGVACLSDYVYRYRIHSGSLTKTPKHCEKVLHSCQSIMDWLFQESSIPEHIYRYRSRAYVEPYRYLARERLLHNQPDLARYIIGKAFMDANIDFDDFVKQCVPLWIRSFLPIGWDQKLVDLRRQVFAYVSQFRFSTPQEVC